MRPDGLEKARADAGDAVELSEAAERAVRLAVGDDRFGQRETDPREPSDLGGGSVVQIDGFSGLKGPSLAKGAVAMGGGRAGS